MNFMMNYNLLHAPHPPRLDPNLMADTRLRLRQQTYLIRTCTYLLEYSMITYYYYNIIILYTQVPTTYLITILNSVPNLLTALIFTIGVKLDQTQVLHIAIRCLQLYRRVPERNVGGGLAYIITEHWLYYLYTFNFETFLNCLIIIQLGIVTMIILYYFFIPRRQVYHFYLLYRLNYYCTYVYIGVYT